LLYSNWFPEHPTLIAVNKFKTRAILNNLNFGKFLAVKNVVKRIVNLPALRPTNYPAPLMPQRKMRAPSVTPASTLYGKPRRSQCYDNSSQINSAEARRAYRKMHHITDVVKGCKIRLYA